MIVGVPKEIKTHEYRVGMTPAGVAQLTKRGHKVLVQKGAGEGSGLKDDEFVRQGATIVETAAEVLDRVAHEAVPMMERVVRALLSGESSGTPQDHAMATRAAKLSKSDAWVDLSASAQAVRLRVNGLQPWPGCVASVEGREVRLLRVGPTEGGGAPGELLPGGAVACGEGAVTPLQVQSPGGRPMPWGDWLRGQRLGAGARMESTPGAGGTA